MDYAVILNALLTIILMLYGDPSLPRKIVDMVLDSFREFIKNSYFPSLEKDVLDAVTKIFSKQKSKADIKIIEEMNVRIRGCFEKHLTVFNDLSTEAKRLRILEKRGYLEPSQYKLRRHWIQTVANDEEVFMQGDSFGVYVPLKHSLKIFLELPGMLNKILDYVEDLAKDNTIISNVMQAKLWLEKYAPKFKNDIVFPLFMYYDEIEVRNLLGSHSGTNKFGAVYFSIACLPPAIASRLTSILFSTIIRAEDQKKCTNEEIFRKIIDKLNELLKSGITIIADGVDRVIKFQLVLILGDNLGLNGICGFTESFRSDYFCRFCKVTYKEASVLTQELVERFRDRLNYENDVQMQDVTRSGIKERCCFNDVDGFFITGNKCLDMMHDFLEGVCMYVVGKLLYTFIYARKYFTVDWLNCRLEEFHFGSESNVPPKITANRLKSKCNLKMSAAEMLCFIKYLGVIIGEKVPSCDEHWQLYKLLRQVLDIFMSPRVDVGMLRDLRDFVEDLAALYVKLYGTLKPKFHHLLHYARLMAWMGPCVHFWSMRYEARHRNLKCNATGTASSKNLLLTIAKKQVLNMCQMMHVFIAEDPIVTGPLSENTDTESCYDFVKVNGIIYKPKTFIIINISDIKKEFGKIENIRVANDEIIFKIQSYEEIMFDTHYHVYRVWHSSERDREISYNDLPLIGQPTFIEMTINKEPWQCIIPQYAL